MTCEQEMAFANVLSEGFALDDALLYLDTHPDDACAHSFYQEHQAAYHMAYDAYVAQFGPLQLDDMPLADCSAWVSTPWPWEMEA